MTDATIPQAVPMATPTLPPPPADVTDGVTALRVACAKWAPHPGASEHHTEVSACNVVLDRDQNMALGATLGVLGTLAVVGFYVACRSMVRAKAMSRFEDAAAYLMLGVFAVIGGLVAGGIIVDQCGEFWSDAKCSLVKTLCVASFVAFLALLRWHRQRAVAA